MKHWVIHVRKPGYEVIRKRAKEQAHIEQTIVDFNFSVCIYSVIKAEKFELVPGEQGKYLVTDNNLNERLCHICPDSLVGVEFILECVKKGVRIEGVVTTCNERGTAPACKYEPIKPFQNGYWQCGVNRYTNTTENVTVYMSCTALCNPGYELKQQQATVRCGENLHLNSSIHPVCVNLTKDCPRLPKISNGSWDCNDTRKLGIKETDFYRECHATCVEGLSLSHEYNTTCGEDLSWTWEIDLPTCTNTSTGADRGELDVQKQDDILPVWIIVILVVAVVLLMVAVAVLGAYLYQRKQKSSGKTTAKQTSGTSDLESSGYALQDGSTYVTAQVTPADSDSFQSAEDIDVESEPLLNIPVESKKKEKEEESGYTTGSPGDTSLSSSTSSSRSVSSSNAKKASAPVDGNETTQHQQNKKDCSDTAADTFSGTSSESSQSALRVNIPEKVDCNMQQFNTSDKQYYPKSSEDVETNDLNRTSPVHSKKECTGDTVNALNSMQPQELHAAQENGNQIQQDSNHLGPQVHQSPTQIVNVYQRVLATDPAVTNGLEEDDLLPAMGPMSDYSFPSLLTMDDNSSGPFSLYNPKRDNRPSLVGDEDTETNHQNAAGQPEANDEENNTQAGALHRMADDDTRDTVDVPGGVGDGGGSLALQSLNPSQLNRNPRVQNYLPQSQQFPHQGLAQAVNVDLYGLPQVNQQNLAGPVHLHDDAFDEDLQAAQQNGSPVQHYNRQQMPQVPHQPSTHVHLARASQCGAERCVLTLSKMIDERWSVVFLKDLDMRLTKTEERTVNWYGVCHWLLCDKKPNISTFLKSTWNQQKGTPGDGPFTYILENELTGEGFTVGHLLFYFTQRDFHRKEIVELIKNYHKNCPFCDNL